MSGLNKIYKPNTKRIPYRASSLKVLRYGVLRNSAAYRFAKRRLCESRDELSDVLTAWL